MTSQVKMAGQRCTPVSEWDIRLLLLHTYMYSNTGCHVYFSNNLHFQLLFTNCKKKKKITITKMQTENTYLPLFTLSYLLESVSISDKLCPLNPLVNLCFCFNPLSLRCVFIPGSNWSGLQGFVAKVGMYFFLYI